MTNSFTTKYAIGQEVYVAKMAHRLPDWHEPKIYRLNIMGFEIGTDRVLCKFDNAGWVVSEDQCFLTVEDLKMWMHHVVDTFTKEQHEQINRAPAL